jgi:hypothetical protein
MASITTDLVVTVTLGAQFEGSKLDNPEAVAAMLRVAADVIAEKRTLSGEIDSDEECVPAVTWSAVDLENAAELPPTLN